MGIENSNGQDAHVRRARIMPAPVPGLTASIKSQPVDGQVAVEMRSEARLRINGCTRINTVHTSPNPSTTQGQRGGRMIRRGGLGRLMVKGLSTEFAVSDEEAAHRSNVEAGQLGQGSSMTSFFVGAKSSSLRHLPDKSRPDVLRGKPPRQGGHPLLGIPPPSS